MAGPGILSLDAPAGTPDDYRHGLLALVAVEGVTGDLGGTLADLRGQVLEEGPDGLLLAFPRLETAAAFARTLRRRAARAGQSRPAVGINLGAAHQPGDRAFARALRRRAGPGEILISAVTGDRLTSRVRAEGPSGPVGWRAWVLPGIGLAGFLGYFLGWFYAIYLKMAAYAETGGPSCWPDWLCR